METNRYAGPSRDDGRVAMNIFMTQGALCAEGYNVGSMARSPSLGRRIKTKGLFNLMFLPTELRMKIYELLLPSSEEIKIPWETIDVSGNEPSTAPHISVSILQTCKKANEEATPILYHNNTFTICLPIEPSPCFLRNFRWSTISMIPKLSFTSSSVPLPGPILPGTPYVRPSFSCSGKEVLERFVPSDFRYSPVGPDMSMALSISNWVSVNVMRVEMNAIQRELEAIIGPNEALLALLSEDQIN